MQRSGGVAWQAAELPSADDTLAMWVLVPTGKTGLRQGPVHLGQAVHRATITVDE